MKKSRIPRKKKKYWKKRGIKLTPLTPEQASKLLEMMRAPNTNPLIDGLKDYPYSETNEDYTWEIQK